MGYESFVGDFGRASLDPRIFRLVKISRNPFNRNMKNLMHGLLIFTGILMKNRLAHVGIKVHSHLKFLTIHPENS